MTVCIPISLLAFGVYKVWGITAKGNLSFSAYPHRSVKDVYNDSMKAHGLHRRLMTLLVDLHDMRYRGDWAKTSDDAKFYGFFLANTGHLWFCFQFPLIRKVLTAVTVNIATPVLNASFMTALFWVDCVVAVFFRGHRDHVVNFSGALTTVGNSCAVLLLALPSFLPLEWVPGWVLGPYVILLTSACTAVAAVAALIEPVASLISGSVRLLVKFFNTCECLAVGALLTVLQTSVFARFQRIFFTRSKNSMTEKLKKDEVSRHAHRNSDVSTDARLSRELHEHHPVQGHEKNTQILVSLKLEGDYSELKEEDVTPFKLEVEADLIDVLQHLVVHVECRDLRYHIHKKAQHTHKYAQA